MTSSVGNGRSNYGRRGPERMPLIRLDPSRESPMYEQLYVALREHVVRGQFRPGERIASTRELATSLGVSRFTVVTAMERLLGEGYFTSRRGGGTFVAAILPEHAMSPAAPTPTQRHRALSGREPRMSARGAAVAAAVIREPAPGRNEPRPFRPWRPALDLFPTAVWAKIIRRLWRHANPRLLDYGDPAGYWPLRKAIADHIRFGRGVECSPQQVIITSGAQQAFDILFHLLADPGDEAWVEEPGYVDVRAALVGAGAVLVPVPVDDQGIVVEEGIRLAKNARLAVVSPSHQFPTGATLSAGRRMALLEWARRAGAWIIEDDYDSHFRYGGRPFLALQRSDGDGAFHEGFTPRVIYVGIFSKTMYPAISLGFCVVPESMADAVINARAVAGLSSPLIEQAALAEFIDDGHYDRHLRRSRMAYRERYEAMQFQFHRHLGGAVTLTPAAAGTHVLGWLAGDTGGVADSMAMRVAREAAASDLVIFPLSRFCRRHPARDALVLGYGGLTPRQIAAGATRLAAVIARVRQSRTRRGTNNR